MNNSGFGLILYSKGPQDPGMTSTGGMKGTETEIVAVTSITMSAGGIIFVSTSVQISLPLTMVTIECTG